jgi:predicted nucleic acid-binding protein
VAVPLVLDTNVVVKLFIEEPDDKEQIKALLLATLRQIRPVVLDFLLVEFTNTVWLKLRSKDLTAAEAETALTDLETWSYEVEVVPFLDVMRPALQAARRYNHAVYDMAFVMLAEQREAPFLTADRRLYLKVRDDYDNAFLLQSMSPARLQSDVISGRRGN